MPLRMRVHDREPIGAALRRFKKLLERSGIKAELRAHEYYEKPCEARRRQELRRIKAIRNAALDGGRESVSGPNPTRRPVSSRGVPLFAIDANPASHSRSAK